MSTKTKIKTDRVCDDCLTVAYDNGFRGYDEQAEVMRLLGDEGEDHDCDHVFSNGQKCACACNAYNS